MMFELINQENVDTGEWMRWYDVWGTTVRINTGHGYREQQTVNTRQKGTVDEIEQAILADIARLLVNEFNFTQKPPPNEFTLTLNNQILTYRVILMDFISVSTYF